jgi:hypothetical protein
VFFLKKEIVMDKIDTDWLNELMEIVDSLPNSKLGCDGYLLVTVDKYNDLVKKLNEIIRR